jgi:hypothetical protein
LNKTIVITDVTKMQGDRVCIAGLDRNGKSIRPVLKRAREDITSSHLYVNDKLVIRPRAKVRFDFYPVRIAPPHIEDLGFDPARVRHEGFCNDSEWESILRASLSPSVADIYDGLLQKPHKVEPGARTRSLGTVTDVQILGIFIEQRGSKREHRISFMDSSGCRYDRVIINDLMFRAFADSSINRLNSTVRAAREIENIMIMVERLYLRLGLARPWLNENTGKKECWMQVTGIHTFPDYLGGESADDVSIPTTCNRDQGLSQHLKSIGRLPRAIRSLSSILARRI